MSLGNGGMVGRKGFHEPDAVGWYFLLYIYICWDWEAIKRPFSGPVYDRFRNSEKVHQSQRCQTWWSGRIGLVIRTLTDLSPFIFLPDLCFFFRSEVVHLHSSSTYTGISESWGTMQTQEKRGQRGKESLEKESYSQCWTVCESLQAVCP